MALVGFFAYRCPFAFGSCEHMYQQFGAQKRISLPLRHLIRVLELSLLYMPHTSKSVGRKCLKMRLNVYDYYAESALSTLRKK